MYMARKRKKNETKLKKKLKKEIKTSSKKSLKIQQNPTKYNDFPAFFLDNVIQQNPAKSNKMQSVAKMLFSDIFGFCWILLDYII